MQNEYKIYVKYIHKCIHIYKNVLDKNEKKYYIFINVNHYYYNKLL